MPATITIDDDVFALAERIAEQRHMTVGEVVSKVSRGPLLKADGESPSESVHTGTVITSEAARQIEEQSFWNDYLQKEANSR